MVSSMYESKKYVTPKNTLGQPNWAVADMGYWRPHNSKICMPWQWNVYLCIKTLVSPFDLGETVVTWETECFLINKL